MVQVMARGSSSNIPQSNSIPAVAMDARDLDVSRLKRMDRGMPDAFPEGLGRIPNNPITAAFLAALLKGGPQARTLQGGWMSDGNGRLTYRHLGKKGGSISIYVDLADELSSEDEQWRVIESLSMLTVDVAVVILAQLCEPSAISRTRCPSMEAISISASAIMRYKGMVRWGAERLNFQEKIAQEVATLCKLRFDIIEFPAFDTERGKWNRNGISISGDRIFDVAQAVIAPPKKDGGISDDHYWFVRFGQWAYSWMNSQGKVWLGPVPRAIVELDHRRNRGSEMLAKKVGISTLMLWGAARSREHLVRRMDSLLESVGEFPHVADRSSHWAGRTYDRLGESLFTLHDRDLLSFTYDNGECLPTSLERNKGWVKNWLEARVQIDRPPYLPGGKK